MTTMHKALAACLLLYLCGLTDAHGARGPKDWEELHSKNLKSGCSAELVEQTLGACRNYGMSVEQADQLFEVVHVAQAEHLPVECICERIEEGLAKKVDFERLLEASSARLAYLREARALVAPILPEPAEGHGDGPKKLIVNLSMALESGLPEDMLKAVLLRNGHKRLGRMAHTVEVGESLYLAGLEIAQVQRMMTDCIDRGLSRHEMIRATELLKEGLAGGRDFESVYGSLWVSSR